MEEYTYRMMERQEEERRRINSVKNKIMYYLRSAKYQAIIEITGVL